MRQRMVQRRTRSGAETRDLSFAQLDPLRLAPLKNLRL